MNVGKYLSVIAISMLKFMGGPLVGLGLKLNWIETAICTVLGMMATIILIVYTGKYFHRVYKYFFPKKPKKFSKTTRIAIKIRKKFGLNGIAFLTPIFFMPMGGGILALAFRYEKKEILIKMLLSAITWALIETLFFYFLKDLIF